MEDKYVRIKKIGAGAFGEVILARRKSSGEEVAIKTLFIREESSRERVQNVRRELRILATLDCPFTLGPTEIIEHAKTAAVVMEVMAMDLGTLIERSKGMIPANCVKLIALHLLSGLAYLHDSLDVLHRDVKPANILISKDGMCKIGDFGLARAIAHDTDADGKDLHYTNQIASRWYRAPEILYGADEYTTAVDIWAAGCVIAELVELSPLVPGRTDIEQIACVHHVFGTPTHSDWPELEALPDFGKLLFSPTPGKQLEACLPHASSELLGLLQSMLTYSPAKRCSAAEALRHRYFTSDPPPCSTSDLVAYMHSLEQPVSVEFSIREALRKVEAIIHP